MQTLTNTFRSRIFSILPILSLTLSAGSAFAANEVSGDELAVWQAAAKSIARDNPASPYKVWYFKSDFTSASFIATAMIDPDREKSCGLSEAEARALISELKAASAEPVKLEKEFARTAGFGIAYQKIPRQRYFATSRVIFDPVGLSAWLSVELSGERGFIVRLDKINGQWSKTSKCGGWYMPPE